MGSPPGRCAALPALPCASHHLENTLHCKPKYHIQEFYPAAISTGRKLSKDAANVQISLYTSVKVFKLEI